MPARLNRWTYDHYRSGVVAFHELAGRDHFTCGAPGWERVADHALAWALEPIATAVPEAPAAQG